MDQGTEVIKPVLEKPGTAKIKKEFLVEIPKRPHTADTENENEGPPKKKKRGQNKHRPQTKRDNLEDCLCPSLVSEKGICTFGENCKYMHDVNKYVTNKPSDIGDECYAFSNHGKCPFTFTCRYGAQHLTKSDDGIYKSKENKELITSNPIPEIGNVLSRDIRMSLRKKKYKYIRSKTILKYNAKNKRKPKDDIPESREGKEVENGTEKNSCVGCDEDVINLRPEEKKTIDFKGKLFLAPLTTCGNLPFRVVCKKLGADITCGEMAMATCLIQGNTHEWALLKRHPIEDIFGVQICGAFPDSMERCAEIIDRECDVDFIDINMGCPIDLVFNKGSGSALMQRTTKLYDIVRAVKNVINIPLTCKMRTGIDSKHNIAHTILPKLQNLGVDLCTVHGRSRQARYTKMADWEYVSECAKAASPMPLFGNGDVLTYDDYKRAMSHENINGVMIARGALIKPWIFKEIKEQKTWDISSSERFDILKDYVNLGLLHWGSDSRGVETTRKFLLEWLSFLHRYIPVGVLERVPQRINEQPPVYMGRNDLETLMASPNCQSWVELSEMLLGKVPDGFQFLPKHKANSYS